MKHKPGDAATLRSAPLPQRAPPTARARAAAPATHPRLRQLTIARTRVAPLGHRA